MLLAARSFALRQSARRSLRQGDCQTALDSVKKAQRMHSTAEGRILSLVCGAATNSLLGHSQKSA
jgi:hypothetical protein